MEKQFSEYWKKYFNRRPFGKCSVCNSSIRVTNDISRFLHINNYNNIKHPSVVWLNDIPLCYKCENLGGSTLEETIELYKINGPHYNYLADWYIMNGYCYHGNSTFKLCGSKNIYDESLCEKHYNYLYEGGRVTKKAKFIR
jgi:hypothetical protein